MNEAHWLQCVAEGPAWGEAAPPEYRVGGFSRCAGKPAPFLWRVRGLPGRMTGVCALYFVGALCKCMGGGMLIWIRQAVATHRSRAGVAGACALAPAHLRMQPALPPMHCEVCVPYNSWVLGPPARSIGKISGAPPGQHGPAGLATADPRIPFSGCLVAGNLTPSPPDLLFALRLPRAHATAHVYCWLRLKCRV